MKGSFTRPLAMSVLEARLSSVSVPIQLLLLALIIGFGTTVYGQSNAAPLVIPNLCPPGGCSVGGGGGGGGTPNYNLKWGASPVVTGVGIGGQAGRQAPAAAPFLGQEYVAFTSANDPEPNDQFHDMYVYIANLQNFNFQRLIPQSGTVFSDVNPALHTSRVDGRLYLAINSQQNPANNNGGFTDLFVNANGAGFTIAPFQTTAPFPFTDNSPSLTSSSQYLFLGARNAVDHTLTLCRFDINNNSTCTNFPGSRAMNFNPAMAYYNNTLYIGYEEQDNTHALRIFTSTDNGQTISEGTNITNVNEDTTSTAPTFGILTNNTTHLPVLYIGFRTNDSGQSFLYRYSTDGINFAIRQGTGEQMEGSPTFSLDTTGSLLYNFYGSDDGQSALRFNQASHN
jgi:hypothetical protein